MRSFFLPFFSLFLIGNALGEGSRNLAPNYAGPASLVAPGPTNDDFAWLEHDGFGGAADNFLDPDAPANERLYVYLKAGETVYFGINRIPLRQDAGVPYSSSTLFYTNQDLSIVIYSNSGTIVSADFFNTDTGSAGQATLTSSNAGGTAGIISSVASSLLGPQFTYNSNTINSGGYTPLSYTNNTGVDQDFYIAFLQDDYTFTTESQLISDINSDVINDVDIRSWYDLWDFTVYNGNEEKPGRLHCKRWSLTAQYFDNLLADEVNFYVQVPATIGGVSSGNFIKKVELGGLDPLSLVIYANSLGTDGTDGDTNGDGVTDFQDYRMSVTDEIAEIEYDLFINNPDIEIYPTTILPTITITDANFFCNPSTGNGEGTIFFESNQVGFIAVLLDLNGTSGYQDGTTDVLIETSISTDGEHVIRWDGLNGLGNPVPSGTPITISGRFTSGPIHIPLWDVEDNTAGMNMVDVRPTTSFNLIYWDDSDITTGSSPTVELDGTNTSLHTWNSGDDDLVNTWSFGYFQINTQNITFTYTCDSDGDGVGASEDLDSDNDGISDIAEGDFDNDTDGDNIPDYLDPDVDGDSDVDASDNWADSNGDGINDNFDTDLDGIPNAIDLDSDNDGVPDAVENGVTDSNNDGKVDSFTDANSNGIHDPYDAACDGIPTNVNGNATSQTNTSVTNADNAVGAADGNYATTNNAGDQLNLYLGASVPTGTTINISMSRDTGTGNLDMTVSRSADGSTYNGGQTVTITNNTTQTNYTYVLPSNSSYIRIQPAGGTVRRIYHISFTYSVPAACSGGSALTLTDTDSDGIDDYLDLDSDNDGMVDAYEMGGTASSTGQIDGFTDTNSNGWNDSQETVALTRPNTDGDALRDYLDRDSDNDGILDNYEGQNSSIHIATAAGDTNSNGILDVYDPNNGGTLIVPVDSDGDGTRDFRDSDSDADGVTDVIEGHDANSNGFADWDTNSNNILEVADFSGYNTDTDGDGIWNVFDPDNGGTSAPRQNTDNADKRDWQDSDDDNDGDLTEGEDVNTNGNWADDFTQGGGSTPDYLFRGDYDGDNLADKNDADSDNDGITDATESNSAGVDPSGDIDADGVANYKDFSDAGVTGAISSAADVNGDGVYDVFDTDLDGIPDFLDLDTDNDGIFDAVEAYGGSVPNGMDQTKGQFSLNDPDNDGLMNYVDSQPASSGGSSTLSNPDSDSDGYRDYRDIDSDGDGIVDIIESQSTASYVAPSGLDSDGDGLDDSYDPSSGGTISIPVNTDALDLRDYLDTDSDNDNVLDIVEGSDGNWDGYGDWDDNTNGTADESDFSADTDGDGLKDAFDNVTKGAADNMTGSNATLQNTDGLDQKNWRDADDDGDGTLTKDEDANSNGNYADDHTDGQGISTIPDYLFNGDFDGDGIQNFVDQDDDNDGITDTNEGYQNVTLTNGSFESPVIGATTYSIMDESLLPGWNTTAADNQVEIWSTGFLGVPSYDGSQFMEINANLDAQLYQDIATDPGTLIYWQIAHRGRDGTDEFRILIGPTSGPIDNGSFSTGNTAWVQYSGYYIVPTGQTTTRFAFESVSTASGNASIGNFIDDFQLFVSQSGYDADTDGLPDYLDRDSDNDGVPDTREAGGTDSDGDGEVDSFADTDSDGLHDPYDADNGGTLLVSGDTDGDGLDNLRDLDSDNDGIPDLIEAGGTDSDGNGKLDSTADTDSDGLLDVVDPDNAGTALTTPDTDYDRIPDYRDLDSDNDGITDTVENGQTDTNSDGYIDGYASDSDGDGLANSVDPDSGGTPIANIDTDNDGIADFRDLDSDNDGYPDLVEGGGTDSDYDGRVDVLKDIDQDGIPNSVDVTQTGGGDSDGDGIANAYDITNTGGNDDDGDGIDNQYDPDKNGDGYSDAIKASPFQIQDSDDDGNKNFRDIDSDNDGIVDVIEFGLTANSATGTINGFTDSDSDGLNDTQDGILGTTTNGSVVPVSPPNFDLASEPGSAQIPNYLDIDSDNDGIPDIKESQTQPTYIAPTGVDTDNDGLDDAYDPNNGGTILTPVNTESNGNADYLDDDADGDTILDRIEGNNANKDRYGDWDADTDGNFDDSGYNTDTDEDGLLDIFDNVSGGSSNSIGSSAAIQDTDHDGTWDFQDLDDDNDAVLTGTDPNTVSEDPSGIVPDYLFGDNDVDDDGITNYSDLDADNDGLANTSEDGGTGIDPGADTDSDGLLNFEDTDIDGDGTPNTADSNTSGVNTTTFTDTNNNGVIDQFDFDFDGVPDYKDRDSDNDGVRDVIELGLTDANLDGTLDEGSGIADANGNGLADAYDPDCDGLHSGNATAVFSSTSVTNPTNANGVPDNTRAQMNNTTDILIMDMGVFIPVGQTVTIDSRNTTSAHQMGVEQSADGASFGTEVNYTFTTIGTDQNQVYTVTGSVARYFRITMSVDAGGGNIEVDALSYSYTLCSGGVAISTIDTDSDGKPNYLDLDSDQDGIPDNREAQSEGSYITPVLADSDGDGIMNVYDSGTGTVLTAINTDGADNPDYLDTDSDNDGVLDRIEAWDSDRDGYADWDTDNDNDPTDESGYSSDNDGDGISYLFDSYQGRSSVNNLNATSATLPDSDSDNTRNFRDTDDDADGILTSNEDSGGNYFVYTQGGVTVPDYLFKPDKDNDGVVDASDADSDNDGISNTEEYQGITYSGGTPFDDHDTDGIYNYLDSGAPGFIDSNSDGVDDRVDRDRDGIPNFFDLDSDNDGITDILEAGLTDANTDGTLDEGSGITDSNGNGLDDHYDGSCGSNPASGAAVATFSSTSVGNPDFSWDGSNNGRAALNAVSDALVLDLGVNLVNGGTVSIECRVTTSLHEMGVEESVDGTSFTQPEQNYTFSVAGGADVTKIYTIQGSYARYIRITESVSAGGGAVQIDHVTYNGSVPDGSCGTIAGTLINPANTDSDALDNYLDLDSDDDGITDNREAQSASGYIAISSTDTDEDGLKDVYDANNGGTAIVPVNSESNGNADYLDTDSDNDNVLDVVEGYDANKNGFSDLDTDQDGSIADETGYGLDDDGDGLKNVFDNYSGYGISNITGSKSSRQDTDADGTPDYRDNEDDTDGILTASEDTSDGAGGGADGIYYNDKTQGGGATPDYLYFNDIDDDGIADGTDLDSDNDGITDASEASGVTYGGSNGPFADNDGDGLFNYLDSNATGHTDSNSDGIDDRVDADRDGIPNFFDLDSDNDGIPDGREANSGALPSGQNSNGQFPDSAADVDNDGLADNVDGGSTSTLSLPDTDGDGIRDFLDLDSDNDGIVDLVEGGGNDFNGDGKLDSFGDTDGDGLGNAVDSDNSGTALTIPNTDSTGLPNYLDRDSDDDGLADHIEGFYESAPTNYLTSYANRVTAYNSATGTGLTYATTDTSPANGIPDYLDDADSDGTPNLMDYGNPVYYDSDGDGIINLFDTSSGGNFYGNVAGAPDRDSDGTPNVTDQTDTPLPLDFLSFEGEAIHNHVTLTWTTTNEVNVNLFEVEYSTTGDNFTPIGSLIANNVKTELNTYTFDHTNPVSGYNFYRIKEIDFDGYTDYSKIIYVGVELEELKWDIYPNPVADRFTIQYTGIIPNADVRIVASDGTIIYRQTHSFNGNSAVIDLTSFIDGIYFIQIELPQKTESFRIIKKK